MTNELFDTHAHYDDESFDGDRDEVLSGLASFGVAHVINIGYDLRSSEKSLELSARYDFMFCAAGVHPHNAAEAPRDFEMELRGLLRGEKTVALGEIGLDYHYGYSPRAAQRDAFARQIILAGELDVPVVIHDRDAHDAVIDILRAHSGILRGGVMHCFSGDRDLAAKALEMGLHIAFGGALTFKNTAGLTEAAAYAPSDRLLIETDCPYLSPAPYRGKRNDSSRLGLIVERLAQIRGTDAETLARITTENAKRLFLSHKTLLRG